MQGRLFEFFSGSFYTVLINCFNNAYNLLNSYTYFSSVYKSE